MQLSGAIPANVLPFDVDLKIDESAYRKHLDSLASAPGVGGVTCNGHAGEVTSLDRDEQRCVVAIAVETVARRVPVVSGIYAENHHQGAVLARDAETEGADALLVMPPNALLYGASSEIAYRHVAGIAEAVSLPLVLFVYPAQTGLQYEIDTLVRLCEIPSVTAVKEWSLDIRVHERNLEAVRSLDRPISFLSSFSTNLLPALVSGADGILSGHGSVVADLHARLLDAVWSRRLDEAGGLYRQLQRLTGVVYRAPMFNMYARMKEHLAMLGHPVSPAVRPPLEPIGEPERRQLRQALVDAALLGEAGD